MMHSTQPDQAACTRLDGLKHQFERMETCGLRAQYTGARVVSTFGGAQINFSAPFFATTVAIEAPIYGRQVPMWTLAKCIKCRCELVQQIFRRANTGRERDKTSIPTGGNSDPHRSRRRLAVAEKIGQTMRHFKTLAIAAGFLSALSGSVVAQDNATAVPVIVFEARVVPFRDRVEALGTLRSNESVAITAVVADKITSIKFEDGDRVEAGQVLVEMATNEETALMEEARSALAEAKAQFERTKGLTERRLTPETVLDQRRRDYHVTSARVGAMEARLADRILRAPFSGRMGLRTVSVGTLVTPGDVIARLEDDSVMKLDFSVPSTFISTLKPGLEITAKARGFDGQVFRGKLASVDNRIDDITRTIRVRAILPNPDRQLVPGLLMNIDLYKNPRQSVAVKEESLVPIGTDTYVYVVDKDKLVVERRRIEVGTRRPGIVEINSGLQAGETVVGDGNLKLRPGAAVSILRSNEIVPDEAGAQPSTTGQRTPDKPAGRT